MKSLARIVFTIFAGVAVYAAHADSVYVSGTVTDSVTGNPINNAAVTVRAGMGFMSGLTARDTTGADGKYSVVLANDTSTTLRVTVSATGYAGSYTGQQATVENPKDGVADRVTVDIKLRPTGITPGGAQGDTVRVTGTVIDSATGNSLDSAVVTVRVGSNYGGTTGRDTTGANGQYSITIVGDTSGVVRVSATRRGYRGSATDTLEVAKPNDGASDALTANIKLSPVAMMPVDTTRIYFTATILDTTSGNPISGASVTITALSGMTTRSAVGTTDAEGKLLISQPWGRLTLAASATISKAGYLSKTVNGQVRNDTISFGTVRLRAINAGDTVSYRFSGRVVSASGTGLNDAAVTVTMKSGSSTVYTGTDTTSRYGGQSGAFSLTARRPYAADMSVTISVSLDEYTTFDTTFTPAAGTNTLVITLSQPTAVVSRIIPSIAGNAGVSVYLFNGRFAGTTDGVSMGRTARKQMIGGQAVIVRSQQENAATTRQSVSIR